MSLQQFAITEAELCQSQNPNSIDFAAESNALIMQLPAVFHISFCYGDVGEHMEAKGNAPFIPEFLLPLQILRINSAGCRQILLPKCQEACPPPCLDFSLLR